MCHILRDESLQKSILAEQDRLLDGDRSLNISYDQVGDWLCLCCGGCAYMFVVIVFR